jgi:hypothetical protein
MIPAGHILPDSLIMVHEHSDHFSLQTSRPCTDLSYLNELCMAFEELKMISKQQYYGLHPAYFNAETA